MVGGGASDVGGGGGGASVVSGGGGGASVTVAGGCGACSVTVRVWGASVCGGGAGAIGVGAAADVVGGKLCVVVVTGPVVDAGVGVESSRITKSTAAVSAARRASAPPARTTTGLRYHGNGAASSSYGSWSNCICGRAPAVKPPPTAGSL